MSRFDQDPNAPYARCTAEDCGFVAATQEEMSEHSRETSTATGETVGVIARSHPFRVVNPTRAERIQSHINMEARDAIDNAVSEFVESVYRLHEHDGVPLRELTAAVAHAWTDVDFRSAWSEYIEDDEDDDDLDSDSPADVQLYQVVTTAPRLQPQPLPLANTAALVRSVMQTETRIALGAGVVS